MAGATSTSYNTPRNAKRDGKPTARLASNEKSTVFNGKQEQEQSCVRIPEHTDCVDADITETVDYLKELSSEDLSSCLATVNTEAFPPTILPVLPTPTNSTELYYNIIHILRARISRPSLPAIVDYHQLFPDHHSTRSYNLLISLSIHHRSYGITHNLFRAMEFRSIEYDIETHRLRIRWIIFQGFWNRAWSYALRMTNKFPGGSIPFSVWLEFCHTRSKGPIMGGKFNPKTKEESSGDVSEPPSLIDARRKIMNTNKPLLIPALQDTPPAGIRNMVQLMVKSGLKHQALKLTEDYFRALPPKMSSEMNHRCLDIVKIHLAVNGKRMTGLPRFNAAKTLYFSFLSLNPSLRPTTDTLIFILSILKKVKHSGTVAWKFISLCKEKWGPELEDRRIQRRVSRLALKEGRMDIVETLLRAESIRRRSRREQSLELEVVGDSVRSNTKYLRPSIRRIYPRIGRETYMWNCLRSRFYRALKKRKAQGRPVTRARSLFARKPKPTKSIP